MRKAAPVMASLTVVVLELFARGTPGAVVLLSCLISRPLGWCLHSVVVKSCLLVVNCIPVDLERCQNSFIDSEMM